MVIFDPVLGGGIVNPLTKENATWYPIKPATNAFLGLGFVQWLIKNEAYNKEYASFANFEAARKAGYGSCSDLGRLVIVDENHEKFGKLLRAEDVGLSPKNPSEDKKKQYYAVIDASTGDVAIADEIEKFDYQYSGEIEGVKVSSVFNQLKDSAFELSMQELSDGCGVPVEVIEKVAKMISEAAPKVGVANLGGTALANGLDSAYVEAAIAVLTGNPYMKGGMVPRRVGAKTTADGERYKLGTIEGKPKNSAKTNIARSKMNYVDTSEYKNRIAAGEEHPTPKLPWYKNPGGFDNQALFGVVNQYPYQAKILVSWMVNTLQVSSVALRDKVIERLKDPNVVPLHIACDAFMGEHAALADYIVPDTTPFESFGIVTQEGYWHGKGNTVRWPLFEPKTDKLDQSHHISYEAFICALGEKLGLPGYGKEALLAADGTKYPFKDAADIFLKGIANLAYDTKPVDDISDEEIKAQALDMLPEDWKSKVNEEEWPKVLKVLSRGSRFWADELYDENDVSVFVKPHIATVYSEKRASAKNAFTGQRGSGVLKAQAERLSDGSLLTEHFSPEEWPFKSCNYKGRFRSVTMLANSKLMQDLSDTNYIEINTEDAQNYGIQDQDMVRVTNPGGDIMEAKALVRNGVTKGTFGVAFGYGHEEYGSKDMIVDGETIAGDKGISAGVHLQTMLDPTVKDSVFAHADWEASSPARSGGMYKIEKI